MKAALGPALKQPNLQMAQMLFRKPNCLAVYYAATLMRIVTKTKETLKKNHRVTKLPLNEVTSPRQTYATGQSHLSPT
jgi:hypothetical protein